MKLNKIYNEDCLEGMKRIPDGSVDLIITSPPYNLGAKHHTGNKVFKAYSEYSDDMPESVYQEWQKNVLNECFRVLKDNGSMWYNHKNRIKDGFQLSPYEWLLDTNFRVKQEIVWFNGSQNFDKIRFYPMTERVYWLVKSGETKMYNKINHHDVFDSKDWSPVGTKGQHKRAFPIDMPKDIMSCFEEAEVVLDPFMGSGTTAVAALDMGRNFIGFELDKTYYEKSLERIKNHATQTDIFNLLEGE